MRENRRRRLLELLPTVGGQSGLAALLKRERNQVWQWTLVETDPRGRGIGPKMARRIESVANRPEFWMDQREPLELDATDQGIHISQEAPPSADVLRTALEITERVLQRQKVSATAGARADVAIAVYEMIQEGRGIKAAEQTVMRMLRALSGVAPNTS